MGTKAARTYGAATLAVGTAISACLMAAPAASAAETTDHASDTPVIAANVGTGLRDALDRARGLFTFNDGAVADAQNAAQQLREQAQNALRDADVAAKLNLANDNVVALTDFVNQLNAHAETLNSVLVSMPDAPKNAKTLDSVTLTMTTRDGQVGVKTLNNVPAEAAQTLRTALEGAVNNVAGNTTSGAVTTATTAQPAPKPTATTSKAVPTTPKATPTSAQSQQNSGDDLNASVDELRRIAAAIEAAKTNNPQAIEEMLARLNDPSRGAGSADINTVTGKNVNTVQNVNANTGSTSVAININPDGGLSISAAQGTDGKGGTAQPGKDTAQDANAVIAALDNLAAALRGEKAPTSTTPIADGVGTTAAAPTSTMTADEAAQHDRLRRALLALTSPEREANSPASRERDALIMVAQALKEGKNVNLEELTTEQMLQVMDWLQNGIPELTKPDATVTATATNTSGNTATTTKADSTATAEPTATVSQQQTGTAISTTTAATTTTTAATMTSSTTSATSTKSTDATDAASKELAAAINGLAQGLADRNGGTGTATTSPTTTSKGTGSADVVKVNTTSTTRVPAKNAGNAGGSGSSGSSSNGGSGSGNTAGSNGSSGDAVTSNATGGGAATETAPATEDAEAMQAEAVSEELAVTGNSTQRMLMLLTLLGGVAAAALFVALRRTRAGA